jgi:glutathione synthase/RimK-type ligase-like ATP-grasp enzyme
VSRAIAIASCQQLPDGDVDDRLLIAALAVRGLTATVRAWTDPAVDWDDFDATVIRSTWDYTVRRTEFLAWADTVPRLHNPAAVLRDNSDKRYLARLAAAGVPIVPTEFFAPGEPVRLPAGTEFVVKPSVGAGSMGAGRFPADAHEAAAEHAAMLHGLGRTVMVQPYLAGVDTAGETALIFLDGRFSHAIRKTALLAPEARHRVDSEQLYLEETITPREPSAAELDLAERVHEQLIGQLPAPLLYARIDLLPSPDGPRLLEAELIEPSLFLAHADGAADRLAAAIADRVAAGRRA